MQLVRRVDRSSGHGAKVCIHCLDRKPDASFNAEHVIPQAFEKFEGNLVLDCVCVECNDYFGGTIDLKIARDSIEGIDRFWSKKRSTSEYKSLGARSTTVVRFSEGSIHGSMGYFAANPDGTELRVFPFPSVGFEQAIGERRHFTWFRREEIPHRQTLASHGVDPRREFWIHLREMSAEDATPLLEAKGFSGLGECVTIRPTEETVDTVAVGCVGRPEMRAAAKIAMNYLASVAGSGLLRSPQFDDVRFFVRHDRGPSWVNACKNPWAIMGGGGLPARGHYIAVETTPSGRIIAQVSLMLRLRYVVHLTSTGFLINTPRIRSAHFFDIDRHLVRPIPVPRLVRGEPLTELDPASQTPLPAVPR